MSLRIGSPTNCSARSAGRTNPFNTTFTSSIIANSRSTTKRCINRTANQSKFRTYSTIVSHAIEESLVSSRHSKYNDDDRSLSPLSNNSSSNGKSTRPTKKSARTDENQTKHVKRKRPLHSTDSSKATTTSARGRKILIKVPRQSVDEDRSELDSDLSNDESSSSKRHSTSAKDYHSTLDELHTAAETYLQSHKNERFNYRQMTKLSSDNLQLRQFRDCLSDPDDRQFVSSINSYLDQFRQRLFAYFTYMKSDTYREHIKQQLDNEMELNKALKAKVHCLETNIKILLDDAIQLLKLRTNELGIEELTQPAQLISYANDISSKHKELRSRVASLEREIGEYDHDNDKLSFILANIQTNGHSSASSANDNTYSILLANMSRQTQQQEFSRQAETLDGLTNVHPGRTHLRSIDRLTWHLF